MNKNFGKGKAELRSDTSGHPHPAPPKKPLPEITSVRPIPPKPLRPPLVDLSCYRLSSVNGLSSHVNVLLLFYFHCITFVSPLSCLSKEEQGVSHPFINFVAAHHKLSPATNFFPYFFVLSVHLCHACSRYWVHVRHAPRISCISALCPLNVSQPLCSVHF